MIRKPLTRCICFLLVMGLILGGCKKTSETATEEPQPPTSAPMEPEEAIEETPPPKTKELIYANASDQNQKIKLDNKGTYEIKLNLQTDQNEVLETIKISPGENKTLSIQPNRQIYGWFTDKRKLDVQLLDTVSLGGGNSFLSVAAYPTIFKNLAVNSLKLDIQAEGYFDPEGFYYCVPKFKVKSDPNQSGFTYLEGSMDLGLNISETILPGGSVGISCTSYRIEQPVGFDWSGLDWRFTNIGLCPFKLYTSGVNSKSIDSGIVINDTSSLVYNHQGAAQDLFFIFTDSSNRDSDIYGHSKVKIKNGAGYRENFNLSMSYKEYDQNINGYAIGIFVTMLKGGTIEVSCVDSPLNCSYALFNGNKPTATSPKVSAEYDQKKGVIRITITSLPGKAVALFASTVGEGSANLNNVKLDLEMPTMVFGDVMKSPQIVKEFEVAPDSQIKTYYFQAVSASDQALMMEVETSKVCSVDIQ